MEEMVEGSILLGSQTIGGETSTNIAGWNTKHPTNATPWDQIWCLNATPFTFYIKQEFALSG
jgi:hypothetical protein